MLKYPSPKRMSTARLIRTVNELYSGLVRESAPITAVKITALMDYNEELTKRFARVK